MQDGPDMKCVDARKEWWGLLRRWVLVKENHQMCDVTNRKILDQLKERKPQVTFSCNRGEDNCNFQCMF